MDTTTKRPQPLVNLGSSLRDQLESVGASMTPPMRWQDLARQVIKNFVHSQVLAGVINQAQQRLAPTDSECDAKFKAHLAACANGKNVDA
jgi:hypothetical protein